MSTNVRNARWLVEFSIIFYNFLFILNIFKECRFLTTLSIFAIIIHLNKASWYSVYIFTKAECKSLRKLG